jgi:penicillin amidase
VTAHARSVIDVGDFGASRFVLLGGQSGNPFSADYKNLIPLWQKGDGVPIHFDDAVVRANARATLTLTPHALALPAPRP